MSIPIFIIWLVTIPLIVHSAITQPKGYFINCGGSEKTEHGNITYISDKPFTTVGNSSTIKKPNLSPLLATLRFFPDKSAKKYCYKFSVTKGDKFLVKTTYYYGGYDGGKVPTAFDQIIDGTRWFTVDTASDYQNGMSSYYEVVVVSGDRSLSVCLARTKLTTRDPFISAIEVVPLEGEAYTSIDFSKYGLVTVARSSFGQEKDVISFPDDQYNRYWQPFKTEDPSSDCHSQIDPSQFWNRPPPRALSRAITTSRGKDLKLKWPLFPLPASLYHITLYFQDPRTPSPYSWRVFDVSVNGKKFSDQLNATASGVSVYSKEWPLSGQTEILCTHDQNATVGPAISAGEIFQIYPLGGRTRDEDVIALEEVAKGFKNPPADWNGDPCLPENTAWAGVQCYVNGNDSRVIAINLNGAGLDGELSKSINNLTALTHIALAKNKLSGPIPEMSALEDLGTLNLDDNQLEGPIPQSLGQLQSLKEISLKNNKLTGDVPEPLGNKNSESF